MDLLYEFLSVIDANGLLVLLFCLVIGSFIILVISSSQKAEIESLRHGLIELARITKEVARITKEVNQEVGKVAKTADENFHAIAEDLDNRFEGVKQSEYEVIKKIRQYDDVLEDIRNCLAIEHSEDDDLEQSIQETIEAKERFHKLSEELSVKEFKEKAEIYLEEMIQETYDAVDNSWGDDLVITCEKQNRFKAKLEKVKEASTSKEAFEAMFSLC